MKFLKMLTLAALAVAATMSFAGAASATSLTSPKGTVYTGAIKATAVNLQLHGSFSTVECKHNQLEAGVQSHGSSVTTKLSVTSTIYSACNYEALVTKYGSFEVHTDSATADGNGTVTWSGFEVLIKTSVGNCVFTTTNTPAGTITGSSTGNAVWSTGSTIVPRTGGSFLCGSSGTMTGSYTIGTPSTLWVD